jgi:MoxR-like ATPase
MGTDGYIVSRPLVEAVNCAIALERPLLIKGEPGTDKTLLARHVAEGLYVYNTLQRLNDARFGEGDVKDVRSYIKLGPLFRVFAAKDRHVLLIDEIDKADLEFPNDILHEIDEMRFTVMETGWPSSGA